MDERTQDHEIDLTPDEGITVHHEDVRRQHMHQPAFDALRLNLTPMIDVVFLLLIYFMLIMEFKKDERLFELDLPRQVESELAADPFALPERPVVIRVQSFGDGPRECSIAADVPSLGVMDGFDHLTEKLRAAREVILPPEQTFIVRPDDAARWEHVLATMNAVKRADFAQIMFDEPMTE